MDFAGRRRINGGPEHVREREPLREYVKEPHDNQSTDIVDSWEDTSRQMGNVAPKYNIGAGEALSAGCAYHEPGKSGTPLLSQNSCSHDT